MENTKYVGSLPIPLDKEEELRLLNLSSNGDKNALDKLIIHNRRLVHYLVNKYCAKNISIANIHKDDLISSGYLGLVKGIKSFKIDKGVKLLTYISTCILNEIYLYLRQIRKHTNVMSYDALIDDDDSIDSYMYRNCLTQYISDVESDVEGKVLKKLDIEKMMELLDQLPEMESHILKNYHGINDCQPTTYAQIGRNLNLSRGYMCQLKDKALNTLRRQLIEHGTYSSY